MLPTVEALTNVYRDVVPQPLWWPPFTRRYISLRFGMRLNFLQEHKVKRLVPAGKINDCYSCTEICCIGKFSTVLLRLRDIATLIDIGRTDLMTHEKPQFSAQELAERPALKRHLASTAWKVYPILKQNRFFACAALDSNGRCSLYPNWPLSCARFPYALHSDSQEVFFSPRCTSFWIRHDAQEEAQKMIQVTVESYNQRIRDAILMVYAPDSLQRYGLAKYIQLENGLATKANI